MGPKSGYLYASPSAIEGLARILDFGNTLNTYNESPSVELADYIAMYLDWEMVGEDLKSAILKYAEEIEKTEETTTKTNARQ